MGVGFLEQDLRRRSFLKWSSAVAGSGALVGVGLSLTGMPGVGPQQAAAAGDGMADADRTVWSACVVNCGSRCPIRLQIKDGTVERVLPDNTGDDSLFNRQIRACVRGRNMLSKMNSNATFMSPKMKTASIIAVPSAPSRRVPHPGPCPGQKCVRAR